VSVGPHAVGGGECTTLRRIEKRPASQLITLLVSPEVFRENGGFAQRAEANE
jgi:hypothetical protein